MLPDNVAYDGRNNDRRWGGSPSAPRLSREFLLAAACAIWPPSERRNETIREAAAGPIDWTYFLRVVLRHRVVGLVHDGLTRVRPAVTPAIACEIAAQAVALARQNLALAVEGVRLQRLFAERDLSAVFIKGVSLAMLAYGNLSLRHSKDLDLVVHPDSMLAAAAVLELNGYRRLQPPPNFSETQLRTWMNRCKEILFVNDEKTILVELHCRLFDNSKLMPDLPKQCTLQIARITEEIGLCTFAEDDLFAYLCAHGAVDRWFRLKWLADIAALLARQPQGGVQSLYRAAKLRGLGRPAAQAILLCHRLMGTVLSDHFVMTLNTDATVRWLEALAMNAMTAEREPTEVRFGATLNALARFLLRSDWQYSLAELKVYSISPVDILMLPLPERLRLLYPALRLPLWVCRHSVHRSRSIH